MKGVQFFLLLLLASFFTLMFGCSPNHSKNSHLNTDSSATDMTQKLEGEGGENTSSQNQHQPPHYGQPPHHSHPPHTAPILGPDGEPLPREVLITKENSIFVLIPAGKFKMGASPKDKSAKSDEKPLHEVYLDHYYIMRSPVTINQFRLFADRTKYFTTAEKSGTDELRKNRHSMRHPDVPAHYISYEDAAAYSEWIGASLPTEAQWEKAARGMEDVRIYPWGDKWNNNLFNSEMVDTAVWRRVRPPGSFEHSLCGTGRFQEGNSPYNLWDMIGNGWEWCQDWYDRHYYETSPAENPQGPETGEMKVLKGGGIGGNPINFRISERHADYPQNWQSDYTFRCVMDVSDMLEKIKKNEAAIMGHRH